MKRLRPKKLLKAIANGDFARLLTKEELGGWESFLVEAAAEGRERAVLRLTLRSWRSRISAWAVWRIEEGPQEQIGLVLEGLYLPSEGHFLALPSELEGEPYFPA